MKADTLKFTKDLMKELSLAWWEQQSNKGILSEKHFKTLHYLTLNLNQIQQIFFNEVIIGKQEFKMPINQLNFFVKKNKVMLFDLLTILK